MSSIIHLASVGAIRRIGWSAVWILPFLLMAGGTSLAADPTDVPANEQKICHQVGQQDQVDSFKYVRPDTIKVHLFTYPDGKHSLVAKTASIGEISAELIWKDDENSEKMSHWSASSPPGKRVHAVAKGQYGDINGQGGIVGGGDANAAKNYWSTTSVDLFLDADTNRDGDANIGSDTPAAIAENAIKCDLQKNPIGAIVPVGGSAKLLLRKVMPTGRPEATVRLEQWSVDPKGGLLKAPKVKIVRDQDSGEYKAGSEISTLVDIPNFPGSTNLWSEVSDYNLSMKMIGLEQGQFILVAHYGSVAKGLDFQDKILVTVTDMGVNLDSLRVYDPKLEGASGAWVKYKASGAPTAFQPNAELVILDGLTTVATLSRKTDPGVSVGTEAAKAWDGKWGSNIDGTDTANKGKYADPGKYTARLRLFTSENGPAAIAETSCDLTIVRLGIVEATFAGYASDEYYPLTFQVTKPSDLSTGLAPASKHYPIPDITWRLGDSISHATNVDVTRGTDKGKPQASVPAYTEIFYPPQTTGTSATVEKDKYNLPICYKMGSRLKVSVRTSNAAYSQIYDRVLSKNALGYDAAMAYPITMTVAWGKNTLSADPANSNVAITPDSSITFCSDAKGLLDAHIGKESLTLTYKWTYIAKDKDGKPLGVEIPGQFTSVHTLYRTLAPPFEPWATTDPAKRPWVAVIDYATSWASAQDSDIKAAKAITEQLNSGAGRGLKYDMDRGAPNYGVRGFPGASPSPANLRMANFLLLLKTGTNVASARTTIPKNPANMVNCSDCGGLTTAFSSILGAQIYETQIDDSHQLNKIRAIGIGSFGYPNFGHAFSFHAFASTDAVGVEKIYDCCLRVGRPDPTNLPSPPREELPTGMPHIIHSAGHGAAILNMSAGSQANGDLKVLEVYDDTTTNDSFSAKCTVVGPQGSTFVASSGHSGTATVTVGAAAGSSATTTITLNGRPTAKVEITQGSKPFAVGDTFVFNTTSTDAAASHGVVSFSKAAGSSANGTLEVVSVYVDNTTNDSFSVKCTSVVPTGTAFTVTTGSGATAVLTVGQVAGNSSTGDVTLHGKPTARIKITQGASVFAVGDTFSFSTTFNYSEYRGSLAAPDCMYGLPGRSSAGTIHRYKMTVE